MLGRNLSWDAVSGVTEGALNAYLVALQSDDVARDLEEFWLGIGDT